MAIPRQVTGVCSILLVTLMFAATDVARAERPSTRTYTTVDGLAHNRISFIARDSRGFLWFCTGDGLSRFDGSRFTNYNVEDGLPSTSINYLLETRNGFYWIATNGGGVALLNSSTGSRTILQPQSQPRFTVYTMSNESVTNRVNVLFEDSAGALWAGTDGGLFRMDESKGEQEFHAVELKIPSRTDLSVQVWAFVEGSDGSLWIATKFGLVHRLANGQMIHYQIQPSKTGDTVLSIIRDREGQLWLAHDTGVIAFNPRTVRESQTESGRSLKLESDRRYFMNRRELRRRMLFQSSSGRIWASDIGHGLSSFDGHDFRPYPIGESADLAGAIAEDRDGNLWLGTNSGAMRIAMQGFTTYDETDALGSAVSSVFEGNSGELYVIGKWQISRLDGNNFVTVKFNLPESVTNTFWRLTGALVLQDSAGEWWVGTRVGLFRFAKVSRIEQLASARPKAVYTTRDGLADDDLTRLFEDSRGDIWIAGFSTLHEVVTRWERATESFHRYSEADGLHPFTRPNSFCEDRAGNLWIGFDEGGLARYRAGRFRLFSESDGIAPGPIMPLYLDRSGRLWFSHPQIGALFRIEDPGAPQPSFVAYTKDDGLSTHRLSLITGDNAGRIYVSNSRGIDRLDPITAHIKHYTSSDGFGTGQLISAFGDRQGNLWFATTKGLLRLIPRPDTDLPPPTILIDALRIAGSVYQVSELGEKEILGLEMEPNQNQISIDFLALSFASGESLRYQYKLEGASDWSAPGDERTVNYPNLAPGAYRFLVGAIGANGAISEHPAVVAFRILPPVWRRWWFLFLAGALVSSVVFAFARSRIARLREARESDRRFRTLAETASDAIITIDADSHIILVNQAAERIFGYSTSEMLGKELTMLMPEYLRHLHRAGFARYKETGTRHISWLAVELPGLHKNGSEIPLELSFGEFTKNDRRFFTGIARDITERKKAEQERKEAEDALRRSREDRLSELESVRRRIATDLHDDIGSSLTQISLLSEVMRTRVDGEGSPLSEPLSKIGRASRELVDAMSDIVWAINPQKDHLSDLTLRMRRFASDVFTARNIKFSLREPDDMDDMRLGANIRREVFLIFKESINNMVRHSVCTEATIKFHITDGRLALEVRDNGKGFDPSQDGEGHGLMSMRARAKDIGGKLEIISNINSGTTVSLEVLLDHQGV